MHGTHYEWLLGGDDPKIIIHSNQPERWRSAEITYGITDGSYRRINVLTVERQSAAWPRALVIMPPGKTRSHMRGFVDAALGLPARQHFLMRSPIGSYLHP